MLSYVHKKNKEHNGVNKMKKEFNTQLTEVIKFIEDLKKSYIAEMNFTRDVESLYKITKTEGRKYIKLLNGNIIYCFINKENGDILRSAGWNKPAKHSRGNIFEPQHWDRWLGEFSPAYLK